jgi:hypothetical protein
MSPSRSRLDRLTHWSPRPGFSQGAGLLALASLVALAGCRGEEAYRARDANAWSGLGGTGFGGGTGGTGNTGTGGTGMAGHGGSVGTGGVGGDGNKGSGGMAGGAAGQGGTGGQPTGMYGDRCQSTADCKQGGCKSGFCCNADCGAICQTCDSSGNSCTPVANAQDPRGDCQVADQTTCGNKGGCNGAGACTLWQAGASCSTTTMCSGSDSGSVINGSVCNGLGHCSPNAPVSCGGFLCQSNACLLSCKDSTACVAGGFCGAGTCVGPNPNLAGNGDLEYGTTDGWSTIPGGTGLSVTSTVFNNGVYSAEQTNRTATYIGPGYYIPTGIGKYNISVWAMQNQVAGATPPSGLLQLRLICAQGGNGYYDGNVAALMPSGVWVNLTASLDTNADMAVMSDCFAVPKTSGVLPGLVRSAVVFVDENASDGPVTGTTNFPNFYVDDLVVTVNDGHNLVGNPNFEAMGGFVDGWSTNMMGSATLSVSTTQHNGGKNSLWLQNRSLWNTAIRYALPLGAADYAVTFYVMQSGVTAHAVQLWAAYSCKDDPSGSVRTKAISQTVQLATGSWLPLTSGAVAFPPSDAPAGCQMTGAAFWVTQADQGNCGTGSGQIECPDLFLDDATIALTNTPPTD